MSAVIAKSFKWYHGLVSKYLCYPFGKARVNVFITCLFQPCSRVATTPSPRWWRTISVATFSLATTRWTVAVLRTPRRRWPTAAPLPPPAEVRRDTPNTVSRLPCWHVARLALATLAGGECAPHCVGWIFEPYSPIYSPSLWFFKLNHNLTLCQI
jgi:hypothetical protein